MKSLICVPIAGQNLVMGIYPLFAVKIMMFEIIAMMIIILESPNILVEKNIMKKTACCQETGELTSPLWKNC